MENTDSESRPTMHSDLLEQLGEARSMLEQLASHWIPVSKAVALANQDQPFHNFQAWKSVSWHKIRRPHDCEALKVPKGRSAGTDYNLDHIPILRE